MVDSATIDALSSWAGKLANTSTEFLSPKSILNSLISLILAGQSVKPKFSKDDRGSSNAPVVFSLGETNIESFSSLVFVNFGLVMPLGNKVHVTRDLVRDNLYVHPQIHANAPQYSSHSCKDIISSKLGGLDRANSRSTVRSTLLLKKATSTSTVIVARPQTLFVS